MSTKQELEEELRMARRTIHHLRLEIAKKGISAPPALLIDEEDTERHIARLEAALGREVTEPRQLPQVERPAPRYVEPPRDYAREREVGRQRERERDISHQLEMLRITRARIAILRQQVKRLGDYAPPYQQMEIREGVAAIAEMKRQLDALGAAYDNLSGDEQ